MRKLVLGVLVVAAGLVLVPQVFAGGGTLNVTNDNPVAGFEKGDLAINFQFNSFPTEFEIQSAMDKVEVARDRLCDATDGQIRLRRVTFSTSNYSKTNADVWVTPASDRAYAGGRLGGEGQVVLFANDCPFPICKDFWDNAFPATAGRGTFAWDGFTLAHELSHYVLNVGDSYDEQRRILTGCGVGPSFDPTPDPGNAAFALDTAINNTIMQGPGTLCLDTAGLNHGEVDPEHWGGQPCRDDADCAIFTFGGAGGMGFQTCGLPQTELSFLDNHDRRAGQFDPVSNAFNGVCPAPVPAHFVQVRMDINPTAAPVPSSCGNMTVEANEECETGGTIDCAAIDASFRAGTTVNCGADCRWDSGACVRGLCGNGVLDAGEECDPTSGIASGTLGGPNVSCAALGGSPIDFTNAFCGFNTCVYDRTSCAGPRGLFTCGDGVLNAGEECDGANLNGLSCASFSDFSGGTLACGTGNTPSFPHPTGCWLDFSGCQNACGNGVIDAGEQCDGAALGGASCESIGFVDGALACDFNCRFETAACVNPGQVTFDPTTIATAQSTSSDGWTELMTFDALGRTGSWDGTITRESEHLLKVYVSRVSSVDWLVVFAADEGEYRGTAGDLLEIARFNLRFSGSAVGDRIAEINGDPVDADGRSIATGDLPTLVLGSNANDFVSFGGTVNGAHGQTADTGLFTQTADMMTAPALALELLLGGMHLDSWKLENGADSWFSRFHWGGPDATRVYADSGCNPADLSGTCLQQRGICNDPVLCRVSWNPTQDRFEATAQTTDLLRGSAAPLVTDVRTLSDWNVANVAMNANIRVDHPTARVCQYGTAVPTAEACMMDATCTTLPAGVCVKQTIGFSLALPAPVPRAGAENACDDPAKPVEFLPKPTAAQLVAELGVPDKVLITMDRSASMTEPVGGLTDRTRIELARSAAMNMVVQQDGKGTQLGLASFAGQLPVDPAQPNAGEGTFTTSIDLPILQVGTGAMQRPVADWQTAIDNIIPVPYGEGTAICAGLDAARTELLANPGGTRGILLLTDGENNRPFGTCAMTPTTPQPWQTGADALDCLIDDHCDGTVGSCTNRCDPPAVAAAMATNDNVRVVLVPTGGQAAAGEAVAMAASSNGLVIEAPDADSLPSAYFEANAHFRGESPSLTRRESLATDLELPDEYPVFVEQNAERFNVQVSMRAGDPDSPIPASDWTPHVILINPTPAFAVDSFAAMQPPGVHITYDDNFLLVSVDNPMPGTWQVWILRGSGTVPQVRSYVTAHVEHPTVGCHVKATPAIVDSTTPVTISARASYGEPVFSGAAYSGEVRLPDGTAVPLAFARDSEDGSGVAVFDPSSLDGVGLYQVFVKCNVADGSSYRAGEAVFGNPPEPTASVPAFTREARGFFFSFGGPLQGLPPGQDGPGDDPDHDGITNGNEGTGDTDGDGIIDALDPNADGDDTPDIFDPDPHDPTNGADAPPTGGGCTPAISVTQNQVIMRCGDTPVPTTVTANATCGGVATPLSGKVISINGSSVSGGTFSGTNPILPEGEVVIRWTATGTGGTSTLDQTVVVSVADTPAACCPAGSTLVEGTLFSDALIRLDNARYCMFGYSGFDLLLGGPEPDVLSGGDFSDELVGGGVGDVLYGGNSADQLTLSVGGTAFGGAGPDSLFAVLGGSTLYGGDGPDAILGSPLNDEIIPGPGPDAVEAGAGDDIVRIYDLCEILPGEALDGGPGVDTLYTPVPVADLLARNVVLTGFEAFVVTGGSESYKAECACTAEVCGDFTDNDCDGTTDEGEPAEVCHDHVDNTCEGLIDEGCPGGPCASETSTITQHVSQNRAFPSTCGGATTDLVFDNFASGLGQWTESGEGDWNTEVLHASTGYPSGASGSPAAHSDGCGTSCTLTLTASIDLRGSSSATLEFLRFVDVELDATDYLRVELFNGSTWATAFSWSGGSGDDDRWHAESFDLSAYLGVANFKVRLVTKEDSIVEHVHIDDLRVRRTTSTPCFKAVGSGETLGSNGAASVTLFETAPGVWSQTCNTGACVPTPDACDGIDNDCDSHIDETCAGCLACNPSDFCGTDLTNFCGGQIDCGCGGGQVCTSNTPGIPGDCCTPLQCLPGFCGFDVLNGCGGLNDCRNNCGAGTYCPSVLPGLVLPCLLCGPEICFDGLDNDCNGGVDNGCGICVNYSSTVSEHVSKARAVGVSCPTTTLFNDTFTALTQWTESGEGDWNTETLHATTGYPATGSSSPALHADGCGTTCTMTQATGIDLRGLSSARLDFLRFVDSELDLTDYLRVEAWNGLTWVTLFNWSGGSGDDNAWHAESVDLAPYLNVSNFRVRFVTKVNLTDEHVHIDDMRISTTSTTGCADYRAIGSNDSLGSNTAATVALKEFPAGFFKKGTCP